VSEDKRGRRCCGGAAAVEMLLRRCSEGAGRRCEGAAEVL